MVTHLIIMSSSYSQGTRIANDYVIEDKYDKEYEAKRITRILNECGDDVSISTHLVQTEAAEWESVYRYDAFFKDVKLIQDLDEFIKTINEDRDLKGIDIAKYIISKMKCTHLKLQKLVYFCYAEYLSKMNKKLFTDSIYAFQYGPVVETIYNKYRDSGSYEIDNTKNISIRKSLEMPARSRITFAKDGLNKWSIIDKTIEKYGDMTAVDLVELTHQKGSPWDKTYIEGEMYKVIQDRDIIKYHKNETI